MEPKVNYTLVGLFIALLGIALLAGVLWLSRTDYRGVYNRYYTYMTESVTGLSIDSSVKYRGVDVGRVKEAILNPDNPEQVRIALDIVRGTPIKDDTYAVLETQGLTGITTVNLRGGSRAAPVLEAKPGENYPVIQSRPSLYAQLGKSLGGLMADEKLPALLASLENLTQETRGMLDAQSRADFKRMLGDLAQIAKVIAGRRSELAESIVKADAALDRFAAVGKTLNERLPGILDETAASMRALRDATHEIRRASASVGATIDGSRADIAQFTGQTLPESALLITEVRQLTATLQRLASELEREPSAMVFGRAQPQRGPGE